MYKRILSMILCICLIFTACTNNKAALNENEGLPSQENKLPADDKYDLTALKSDKQGIDISAGFQLTSKDDINKKYVKDNLRLIPEEKFKIEEISSTVYNIIPLSRLENDKIYQVKLDDEDYAYSWAFQTKKRLKIESTLPAHKSDNVPANSGIEIYFSLGSLDDMDEFFEINPSVEGKFINNNDSIVFVPEQLDENTIYTVTVRKGFGLEDGSDRLEEDYKFSFRTQSDINSQIYFERPVINIHEDNPMIVDAYVDKETEYNINIYQYKNPDEFAEDVYNFAETGKFPEEIDKDILTLDSTVKQKPFMKESHYYRNALFELPDDLPKGYYLLEFEAADSNNKQYLFLQINDILIYNAIFENQFLIFACDGKTSREIRDAEVILNNKVIGKTNADGTLVSEEEVSKMETAMLRVKAKGYNDFIFAESLLIYDYYYKSLYDYNKYMVYIDTDRPVYLPDDTINVWGFARYRDNKSVNKVKIELVEETGLVLETKYVELTDIGTYEAQFVLDNITSEWLTIKVYDNDIMISNEYISVRKYTKPLYILKGALDREFAFSGENIDFKINANFFDGYPVPNLKLNFRAFDNSYSGCTEYKGMDQVITLNENGEYTVNLNTEVKSSSWRPVHVIMDCYNNEAEETSIDLHEGFEIFPKHKMLQVEQDDDCPESVNILFHEMNIENYNTNEYDYYSDYKNLRGIPLNDTVHVAITEKYHEKVKIGEQYDFINKVNEIKYDYKLIENTVYAEYINVVSGTANVKIPDFDEEKNYLVEVYYEDNNGGIEEEYYVSGKSDYYSSKYYQLNKDDSKGKYRLNEGVNLQLTYDDKAVEDIENDNMFIMYMRSGLIDYAVSGNTSVQTVFKEDFMPNVMLEAIYVKDGYIYPVEYADTLQYDRTERELNLDITTDKEEYRPGEEVTLKIKVTDEKHEPCVADVNISVVDEAYFAMFNKWVDTLNGLYNYWLDSGLRRTYLSNIDLSEEGSGAEMGGGGGEDGIFRDEFKDTNIFRTITTDKDGNGTVKFKLADNLTSWRITCQGISDELYAGSETKNITVSLPFYVDMIMGREYLKEDRINVSLRVFGTASNKTDQVEYKVDVINKDTSKKTGHTAKGNAVGYVNMDLGNLAEGNYEIFAGAKCNGNEDGIKEEFSVVDSVVYFNNTDYYKLSDNTVLDEVYSNPVITLFNESNSDFYNSLNSISSNCGRRIDQTVCSMIAAKYINEYFDTDLYFNEEELLDEVNKYESENGGIRLFPYSEPDAEITAKLVHVLNNDYLESKLKTYFKNMLNADIYTSDMAAALWGLSKYKEPVLLTIYDLLEYEDLGIRDKIYLSLALAELGDNKTAVKYYREIEGELKKSGDYLHLWSETDAEDNYELTALLSILGVKVQDYDTSDKLFKYIYNKPSRYTLSNFEQLIYIMNRDVMKLDEIKDLFGEVTVTANGSSRTYKLKLFDRESFAVAKDKIKDVKFSGINGSIACKVEALGNKDDLEKNKTDDFSILIDYTKKDASEKQTVYNHSDIVRVTVTPTFNSSIESGIYEITYVIPAGFRYMEGYRDSSWGSINGQKLTFDYYYNKKNPNNKPIVVYMQAAQKGEYTVDYAVIKENFENKLNYVEKTALTVN